MMTQTPEFVYTQHELVEIDRLMTDTTMSQWKARLLAQLSRELYDLQLRLLQDVLLAGEPARKLPERRAITIARELRVLVDRVPGLTMTMNDDPRGAAVKVTYTHLLGRAEYLFGFGVVTDDDEADNEEASPQERDEQALAEAEADIARYDAMLDEIETVQAQLRRFGNDYGTNAEIADWVTTALSLSRPYTALTSLHAVFMRERSDLLWRMFYRAQGVPEIKIGAYHPFPNAHRNEETTQA